jgi:hypothetical protein
MQRFVDDPASRASSARAAISSDPAGDIPDVGSTSRHRGALRQVLARRDSARVPARPGPWRITFDTNPDTCNLRCVMCEEHSPHSPLQVRRKAGRKPRRVMPIELLRRVFAEAAPTACAR